MRFAGRTLSSTLTQQGSDIAVIFLILSNTIRCTGILWRLGLLGLPEATFRLDYDLLVSQTENVSKKLMQHISLPWDELCLTPEQNLRSVKTASGIQVRRPIYTGSSEEWRKYSNYLLGDFTALALKGRD